MEKIRSKSTHFFQKESILKKTLRNANNISRLKMKIPLKAHFDSLELEKQNEIILLNEKRENPKLLIPIKDLRKDLLYIPQYFFDEPSNINPNSSFVSFNELHRKQPLLFPDLNYVSKKELQIADEKRKMEENMSALDRFFKDMKGDSQNSRSSLSLVKAVTNFRELNQLRKELTHNKSQKKKYDNAMDKSIISSNDSLIGKYQRNHKKMPPIKIYSTANEKFHRMKENSTTKKEIVKQTNFSLSNLDSYPMSRLSFFKYENLLGIKPMACEGSTLSIVDNNGYLIGGRGVNFKPEIACFNIEKKKWKFLNPSNSSIYIKKEQSGSMRMNHSASVYKNSVVIFGGEKEYNVNMKARQCLSDVEVLQIEKNEWKTLYCKGNTPEPRRNHIAVIVGNTILFHGGMNSFSKCLNDAAILDLFKTQWISCDMILDLPALSCHTGVFVSENEKKYSSIFFPRIDVSKNNNYVFYYIKEEGIYIFGGKNQSYQANNDLLIIKTGNTPFRILKPEQKGIPPLPRFNHAMKFCKYLNCIIVYGGRNDELNCCFCDIHILNLESFVWIKLNVSDNKYNEGKFSFGCDIFQSQMLIFGGVNFNGFINNDLYVIEFDDSNQKSQVLEEAFEDPIHLEPKIQAKIVSCLRTFLPITVVEKK